MTSDQETVCGTCSGDPRDGNGYHAYDCPERTGPIPAPVVHSDDRKERTMNVAEAIEIVNAATNKESGEDCDACTAIEDTCPYHDGIEAGVRWLGDVVKRAVDDPESVAVPRG